MAAAANAASIAIPLDFDGPQPNHFGARRGKRETLELDGCIGRTQRGGSCNVDVLRLTPHCNGTHTETVSHIVDEDIWIGNTAIEPFAVAVLVSVPLISAACTEETYQPRLDATDSVITGASLREACASVPLSRPNALIIRTLPNEEAKQVRAYSREVREPWLHRAVSSRLAVCHKQALPLAMSLDFDWLRRGFAKNTLPY